MKLLVFTFAVLIQQFLKTDLLKPFYKFAEAIHQWALNWISKNSTAYDWFYSAILFGEDLGLKQKPEIKLFIALGLYHLIVVSGGHLIIIEQITSKLFSRHFTFIILFIFTAANLFQPACLRAFLQWIFQSYFKKYFSHSHDLLIFTIGICVFLKPVLINSLSFMLSCAASLALQVSSDIQMRSTGKTFLCVLFTSPFILVVQPCLSWIVIPANVIAMPILEMTLMPFSLLMFFLPLLKPYCEVILNLFFKFLNHTQQWLWPQLCLTQERERKWGLILLVFLFLLSRFLLVVHSRQKLLKTQD